MSPPGREPGKRTGVRTDQVAKVRGSADRTHERAENMAARRKAEYRFEHVSVRLQGVVKSRLKLAQEQ